MEMQSKKDFDIARRSICQVKMSSVLCTMLYLTQKVTVIEIISSKPLQVPKTNFTVVAIQKVEDTFRKGVKRFKVVKTAF